ncbi:glycoside hydrolase domain-containing protein [Scytonema sp. PCC 10023]|uniref:glycoside hydrolase domain-containing protein n=1 Tax=Scytonema sp. PCC 10023 TaxID=1680591 RepID=UPI0039C6121E
MGLAPGYEGVYTGTRWRIQAKTFWGVDSVQSITQSFLDQIRTTYGSPDFFGRYLGGRYGMTADEVALAQRNGIKILVVDQSFGPTYNPLTEYSAGEAAARKAISNAEALGIPNGVAIFADIEIQSNIAAPWIQGWFDTLASSIYKPGFYSDTIEGGFSDAYCQAVRNNSNVGTSIIWSNEPPLDRTTKANAPAFAPTGPDCNAQVLGWQYGIAPNEDPPNVDTNLVLSWSRCIGKSGKY